jgi:hypothetical protein
MAPIKQFEDITREDFLKSHYWKFYPGNNGESNQNKSLIPQDHPDYDKNPVRLIYTHYTLHNGMILDGFLYESPPDLVRHTIFYKYTGFETWYGFSPPYQGFLNSIYHMLQLKGDEIFPITWESCGKEYSGVINGFGYHENGVKKEII